MFPFCFFIVEFVTMMTSKWAAKLRILHHHHKLFYVFKMLTRKKEKMKKKYIKEEEEEEAIVKQKELLMQQNMIRKTELLKNMQMKTVAWRHNIIALLLFCYGNHMKITILRNHKYNNKINKLLSEIKNRWIKYVCIYIYTDIYLIYIYIYMYVLINH